MSLMVFLQSKRTITTKPRLFKSRKRLKMAPPLRPHPRLPNLLSTKEGWARNPIEMKRQSWGSAPPASLAQIKGSTVNLQQLPQVTKRKSPQGRDWMKPLPIICVRLKTVTWMKPKVVPRLLLGRRQLRQPSLLQALSRRSWLRVTTSWSSTWLD